VSSGWSVAAFDPSSDAGMATLHQLQVLLARERLADEPPVPLAEFVDDVRVLPRFREQTWWVVRDADGSFLGTSDLTINHVEDNQDLATVWVGVRPDARRRRLGFALLEPAIAAARAAGRTSLDSWASAAVGNEPFFGRLGFQRRYLERHSRLRIAGLDEALMKEWVAHGDQRATGYSLVGWDGPCPEDLIEGYAKVLHVMNTAPLEDFEMEDEVFTPDRIRAKEEAWARTGQDWWVLVALEDETGGLAGLTELGFLPHRPWLGVQGNTGVDPVHRGHGLGRWLKAAMILRLIAERPAVECVDTWNADSNGPMLAINEAMGFEPLEYIGGWQAELDTVAERMADPS
jgi:mycothiol synthase